MNDMTIFYTNKKGGICYNDKCIECYNNCKQSYRAIIVS